MKASTLSIKAADLLSSYAVELTKLPPKPWARIVVYKELKRDADGYLCNISLESWWDGENEITDLPGSVASSDALLGFYEHSESTSQTWTALRLEIMPDGKYASTFFYDSTPLLDGNYSVAESRFCGL